MRTLLSALTSLLIVSGLSACQLVYKLPTRQGNVIEQKKLDQLEVGMSREQVRFLLGTPLAADPFDDQRWDYLGYYRAPRGATSERTVALFFDGNTLVRMEGTEAKVASGGPAAPSLETLIDREEKQLLEEERRKSEAERGLTRPDEAVTVPAT